MCFDTMAWKKCMMLRKWLLILCNCLPNRVIGQKGNPGQMNRRSLTDGKPIQVLSNSYMTVRRLFVIVKGTIGMILRKIRVNIAGPQSNHCESTVSIKPPVTQILWYSIETMAVYKHRQQRPLLILKTRAFLEDKFNTHK